MNCNGVWAAWKLAQDKRNIAGQVGMWKVRSVVVITSALHAEGHGFKPRCDYLLLLIYTPIASFIIFRFDEFRRIHGQRLW